MARTFNGSSAAIRTNPGALAASSGIGGRTFAAIVRKVGTIGSLGQVIIGLNASGDVGGGFAVSGVSGRLMLSIDGDTAQSESTFTVDAANNWVFVASSKVSGTAAARHHKYVYDTNTWTHQNGGSSIGDGSLGATVTCEIGAWADGFDYYEGDIAAVVVFPTVLTDAQVESLPYSLMTWHSMNPAAGWLLDQSNVTQKIVDFPGGGANEVAITGTSVSTSSVPGFTYGLDTLGIHSYPSSGLPPPIEGGENSSTMYNRGFGI